MSTGGKKGKGRGKDGWRPSVNILGDRKISTSRKKRLSQEKLSLEWGKEGGVMSVG